MDLKHKVGPFPVYVWAGMATVAILAGYIYLRRGSGATSADATGDTGIVSGAALDPTTGQPYAGSVGDAGSTLASGASTGTVPDLTGEVSDVASLISTLTGAGLLGGGGSQSVDQPGYDDTNVWGAISQLQASLQNPSDHSAPPAPASRAAAKTVTVRGHGLQRVGDTIRVRGKGSYVVNSNGSLRPATSSGSHTAQSGKSGASAVGKKVVQVKGHGPQVVGARIVVRGRPYIVNSNATLRRA